MDKKHQNNYKKHSEKKQQRRTFRKDRSRVSFEYLRSLGEGIVLDFYPQGKSFSKKRPEDYNPLSIILTIDKFQLIEVYYKKRVSLDIYEKIKLHKNLNDIISIKPTNYSKLSVNATERTPEIITNIVSNNEDLFVNFFNIARPITTQLHQLRLLPGIGQKRMWIIIESRDKKVFVSFDDIKKRTNLSDPQNLIIQRILLEITSDQKYYLFVKKETVER